MAEQPINSKTNSSSTASKSGDGLLREQHLRLAGTPASLPHIREAVVAAAERCGLNSEDKSKIEMAVGEACSNIVEHAYNNQPTRPDIEVDIREFANRIEITILDYSLINFPVDQMTGLSLADYLEEERRRGLGLYIIHDFVDRVEHRFICGQGNELRLVKYFAR